MTNDTKMDLRSMDIADEQKARLKQLFPEVFNEDKIDFDKLKLALGEDVDTGRERFGMNWPGKAQAIRVAQEPSMATLKPDRDASVDFDTTENLFIEGDNLEVLKLLQKSYFGKIKMIYIDPPYNTGKEFIYPDKYAEGLDTYLQYTGQLDAEGKKFTTNTETDGRYHSKWMNMMWPRLFLARNLLTDDGVIFISIDDHELDNLKKLCNEVFGEDNFKVQIIIENDSRARQYDVVATTHEYMLVYSKSSEHAFKELVNQEKTFKYNDNEGGFDLYELRNRNIIFNSKNRPNLRYPFWVNPNKKDDNNLYEVSLDEVDGWAITFPQESQGVETVWRWGRDKAIKNVNKILFARLTEKGVFQIVKKYRGQNYTLNSVWSEKEIKTDKGTLELKKLFGGKIFDFPKPTNLIKKIIQLISDEDAYVLDFFFWIRNYGPCCNAVKRRRWWQ